MISTVWCVSTYFEYKRREEDPLNMDNQDNIPNTINNDMYPYTQELNYSHTHDTWDSEQTRRDFEGTHVAICEGPVLFSPPSYNQIGYLIDCERATNFHLNR